MTRKRTIFLLIADLLLAFLVAYAWRRMFTGYEGGLFSSRGLRSLRYFTVDSNLFMGLCCVICAITEIRSLLRGTCFPAWTDALRCAGVTGVMITFLVVLAFLGPVFGFSGMYTGANLYFHGIIPILAFLSFILTRSLRQFSPVRVAVGMLPMLAYGVYYAGNLLLNGLTAPDGRSNDWYGFLGGDLSRFPFALLILILADLAISFGVCLAGSCRKKNHKEG